LAQNLKQYLPTHADASACRPLLSNIANVSGFLDSFDSNYFSSWTVRSRKGFLAKVHGLDQGPFFVTLLHKSDIFEVSALGDYQNIEMLGFVNPSSFVDIKRRFHCLPAARDESTLSFAEFIYYIGTLGKSIVCKCGSNYGILRSDLPNIGNLSIISDSTYDQIRSEITFDYSECDSIASPKWDTTMWFASKGFPGYLSTFLESGKVLPASSQMLEESLMGIWKLSAARFLPTPVKKKSNSDLVVSKVVKESKKSLVANYETQDSLLQGFKYLYSSVLFEKYPLLQFLQGIIPDVYERLGQLLPEKECPIVRILTFFTQELMVPIHKLDEKYSKVDQQLAFLLDNTPTDLDMATQGLANTWFLKKKQAQPKTLSFDARNVLKKAGKELKIRE
jgi:hypothetical protein